MSPFVSLALGAQESCGKPGSNSTLSTVCVNPGVNFRATPELHKFGSSDQKSYSKLWLQGLSCAAVSSLAGA